MDNFQLFIILMAAAFLLVGLAERLKVSYPIILVLGGACLGFVPGLTAAWFDPNLLLVIVLPPLLQFSAVWISYKDFKKNIRSIFSLALGLVIATTVVVAALFHSLFPELGWPLAFTFGAIVSPPDAVSANTILKRFSLESNLKAILEGESLINDAFALVIYKFSVIVCVTGVFSWQEAFGAFVLNAVGGVAIGGIIGYLVQQFVRRFIPSVVGVMFSFCIPYISFITAKSLEVSGVLAVVTTGLITSCFFVKHYEPVRRVLSVATWGIFIILLNCLVFILIGLQLRSISESFSLQELHLYTLYAILITFVMMFVRTLWVALNYGKIRHEGAILAWCGMRGILSLACALALPHTIVGRDVVVFISFEVILLTLIIPGLTLPWLLKKLKLHEKGDSGLMRAIRNELIEAAEREIERFLHLNDEERVFLRNYIHTRHRVHEISNSASDEHKPLEEARRKLIHVQRQHLLSLWEKGKIEDTMLKFLELELDLEEQLSIRAEAHLNA